MLDRLEQTYHDNKNFRYGVYAVGSLAAYAAAKRIGSTFQTIGLLFCGGTLFLATRESYKIIHSDNKKWVLEEWTDRAAKVVFTTAVIWMGIAISNFQTGLNNLFAARKPLEVINSISKLASVGGYNIPLLTFVFRFLDDYFYKEGKAASVQAFVISVYTAWKEKTGDYPILDLLLSHLIKPCLQDIASKKPEIFHKSSWREFTFDEISFLYSALTHHIKKTKYFSRPHPTVLERIRIIANTILFYGLKILFTATQVYSYTLTTVTAFVCGLFYPTQLQSKKDLRHQWEKAPDFFGPSIGNSCREIEFQARNASFSVDLGYPMAFMRGLWLAEAFRYYFASKLPIPPLELTSNDRWKKFAGGNYDKITPGADPNPDYNGFKQKVLEGKSAKKLLGITSTPLTQEELSTAYKKWAMIFHPDKNQDKTEEAAELFKCMKAAKNILQNELDKNKPAPPPSESSSSDESSSESSSADID